MLTSFSDQLKFFLLFSRLEHSAVNLAGSVQQGGETGSAAPSLMEVCSTLVFLCNNVS